MSDSKKDNTIKNTKNFTPYGTDPEKDKMVKSDDWEDRLEMAEEGYGLDVLINDEDWEVRTIVAKQGYGLDILVNDESWIVRRAVAEQGYGLDILVNDKFFDVRTIIADQGYDLDVLINDENWRVRAAVARQGYGLDILVNDKEWGVRRAVAKQGYGLNILINYKHEGVRKAALDYLKEKNLTISEWCNQNNTAIDLGKLAFSPYPEVRAEAIKSGYIYKKDEIYIDPNCKFIPYGKNCKKDKMIKSNNWKDCLEIAKEGYGLDVLINDEEWRVRRAIADQGYGLNVLVNDESEYIRESVAKQGYGLNVLINDEYWVVRKAVLDYLKENNLTLAEWCNQNNKEIDLGKLAFSSYLEARIAVIESGYVYKKGEIYIDSNCKFIPYGTDPGKDKMVNSDYWRDRLEMAKESYGLDVLINDEDYDVRIAVVKQGYGLDILINDKDWRVREAVNNYLTSHNLTLEQWKSNQNFSKTNIINQAKNAINDGKIDVKNVADNIKSTKSVLNDSINKTNKTNEMEK